ncbi:transcriptional regulator with XRE-family HTH domain [Nocardioides sp. BE266]|uniref:helix-turn-helix transcriptional regulator n=1 Tax=Nocardioides sp. BE266 TaxID=2817725 RepID=UPI002859FB6D|nr:helix-turn-helix domain-containing protein [Nocardioides sp. BE266]MDR7252781.1 transcriptional regulator with XRE-family HTH domain [Nocardioides sp. BE266]
MALLGLEIARARRARRWTVAELAERAGVSHMTVRAAEKGALTVAIGTVFEIAAILGIDLFAPPGEIGDLLNRSRDRLALLPSRVREAVADVDDDF